MVVPCGGYAQPGALNRSRTVGTDGVGAGCEHRPQDIQRRRHRHRRVQRLCPAAQTAFLPVLEELSTRGLIYVDDGTSARSTAGQIARDLGLGFSVAQVKIDSGGTPESMEKALQKLETIALENGFADRF